MAKEAGKGKEKDGDGSQGADGEEIGEQEEDDTTLGDVEKP